MGSIADDLRAVGHVAPRSHRDDRREDHREDHQAAASGVSGDGAASPAISSSPPSQRAQLRGLRNLTVLVTPSARCARFLVETKSHAFPHILHVDDVLTIHKRISHAHMDAPRIHRRVHKCVAWMVRLTWPSSQAPTLTGAPA